MNKGTLKGNWKELKGLAKERWGKLTDDDLKVVDGQYDQLVGRIQKRYGANKEEAQKMVDEWQMPARR
ncbi:MAG: CsbD family protein [Chloroflexi bacterium]|nr:CsbD family protein [Chloroflexota bacterium]